MSESDERVREALAAYLDHLEMGGPAPDTSHLSAGERRQLDELVESLELTEGVAFGPRSEAAPKAGATTPEGERLLTELRDAVAADVRIDPDDSRLVSQIGGIQIGDRWVVGSFGGRIRVWLLGIGTAHEIEANADCLVDLGRVFRIFPDTAAVALVGGDLSCLIVEPEDCAPSIQVPAGDIAGRRYRRAIRPAAEAIPDILEELSPYWDPLQTFQRDAGLRIDFAEVGEERVRLAIERQRAIGERARKGNPKKDALLAFGGKEIAALNSLATGVLDGSVDPDEVEERIERWAEGR